MEGGRVKDTNELTTCPAVVYHNLGHEPAHRYAERQFLQGCA